MVVFKTSHHLKYSQNEIEYLSYYPVILWVYGGRRLMNKLKRLLVPGFWQFRLLDSTWDLAHFYFVDFPACEVTCKAWRFPLYEPDFSSGRRVMFLFDISHRWRKDRRTKSQESPACMAVHRYTGIEVGCWYHSSSEIPEQKNLLKDVIKMFLSDFYENKFWSLEGKCSSIKRWR